MKTNSLYVNEYQNFDIESIKKALSDDRRESSAVSNPQEAKSAPKESHPNQSIKNTIDSQAQKIFDECVKFAQDKFLKSQDSKTLRTQNYVGLIQTKSGFCLEILPKICNIDEKESKCECKSNNADSIDKEKLQKKHRIFLQKF